MSELALDVVPEIWRSKPYDFPSMRPLGSWLINLRSRIDQLQEWTLNPLEIPRVTWISGLFLHNLMFCTNVPHHLLISLQWHRTM